MSRILAAFVCWLFALNASGCYSWVEIKPSELEKLNGSYERATGATTTPTGTVVTVERTVAHVERPDGTLAEIEGDFDARIYSRRGVTEFEHPVNSEVSSDQLIVAGGNRRATTFELEEVQKVEVSQYDQGATIVASALGGLAIGALLVGLIFASGQGN